jgi:WD40 repeat protein
VLHRFGNSLFSVGTQRCTPAVAPDDSVVCVGSATGLILLLNMETGSVEGKLSCHHSAVSCVAWNTCTEFSPAVLGSVDKRGDVVFWKSTDS